MQTRSQNNATECQLQGSSQKQIRQQNLLKLLNSKPSIQKAKLEAKKAKKREEKRQQKELFAFQKQQLKSRCMNTTSLNFAGDYAESDEQVKTRLHSHLLTGRLQNKALQAFALEVLKKLQSNEDLVVNDVCSEHFRVPHSLFKRAARKVTEMISSIPKSILKHRLSEYDYSNANTSLQRQIRALKRSERNQKLLAEDVVQQQQNNQNSNCSATKDNLMKLLSFEQSECHFMKEVLVHPERDMDNKVKIIDQQNEFFRSELDVSPSSSLITSLKPSSVKKSSLQSLDLATRSLNKNTSQIKNGRRLQFSDSVEVYFYPENKEQHDHHLQEDYDEDEDELRCEDMKLDSSDSEEEQEIMDPSFEELLLNFITHSLMPRLQSSSENMAAQIGKRSRRGRANSLPSVNGFASDAEAVEVDASDSDKSLSTNENSFPITGISSALSSAEMGTSPTQQKTTKTSFRSNKGYTQQSQVSRLERAQKTEIQDAVQGLPTRITIQCQPNTLFPLSTSPILRKKTTRRSKLHSDIETEKPSTPNKKCFVGRVEQRANTGAYQPKKFPHHRVQDSSPFATNLISEQLKIGQPNH